MSKRDKLLQKALATPGSLTFREFVGLARSFGFEVRVGTGSHRVLVHEGLRRSIPVQSDHGLAKRYQVRQLIDALRQLGLVEE